MSVAPPAEGRLAACGLGRDLARTTVLDGVDLDVRPGEVRALVGLNGAGKTTLMRLLLGMLRPDRGQARLFDVDVARLDPCHWARVGHLIEVPFAYPELTARENIEGAALLHGMPRASVATATAAVIDALGLGPWADRRARTLSLGTRQKVGLGAALVHDPRVLVLDEPGNALDPLAVVGLRELVRAAAGRGAAVLVSSHHLDEMARMADTVTVLHRGRTAGDLPVTGPDVERSFFERVYAIDAAAAGADQGRVPA